MTNVALLIDDPATRMHFVGVAGTGMSALAQYRALGGGATTGSDRSLDQGTAAEEGRCLAALGIGLLPQDGRGADAADVVVASTAVEDAVPDVVRARARRIPVLSRAALLAHHVDKASVGIAGTSGKSTVTAMVFEALAAAGRDPGLITGGRLLSQMEKGRLGNAARGGGKLVFEADESDGSLVQHRPEAAVVLNLHKDHMEPERVLAQFEVLKQRTRGPFVVADDARLASLRPGALVYGFGPDARFRGENLVLDPDGSAFRVGAVDVRVTHPGAHNASNALAALAMCAALDVDLAVAARALGAFCGVFRRFQRAGGARGIEVIDDFAHNPEKICAALAAAQARSKRVLAVFQPHGFAPMKFLGRDIVRSVASALRPQDRFWMAPIYYSGGTADRTISHEDLLRELRALGAEAAAADDRTEFARELRAIAREGDLVLVMGARDPTLPDFAKALANALE